MVPLFPLAAKGKNGGNYGKIRVFAGNPPN
jgi:hypothetical protein